MEVSCARTFEPELSRRFFAIIWLAHSGKISGFCNELKAGIRKADDDSAANVLLDFQIALNTPVEFGGTSVRGPHLDCPRKLFVGLLYFRDDADDSEGGDLEFYCVKGEGTAKLDAGRTGQRDDFELVKSVPFKGNVLVLFLNSPEALHGVSIRSRTMYPRIFLNLLGELKENLFVAPSSEAKLLTTSGPSPKKLNSTFGGAGLIHLSGPDRPRK